MQIQKDSRQIPKKQEIVADKMYSDVVYAWLQVNSCWDRDKNVRWIGKNQVSFSRISGDVGLSRQTVSNKFKRLLEIGLVRLEQDLGRYELVSLRPDMAMLVERTTLRRMLSAFNENTINVYVYLLNRYLANRCRGYEFTIEQVKYFIGLSMRTSSNNYIIQDILDILERLGLLKYKVDEDRIYQVVQMANSL